MNRYINTAAGEFDPFKEPMTLRDWWNAIDVDEDWIKEKLAEMGDDERHLDEDDDRESQSFK